MKRTIFIISALVVMAGYAVPVFGWGQKGHRIIAEIAYDNLSRKARKQVDKTLGKHGMVYWANWADEIKSDTIYPDSYDWHFQDFDGGLSDSTVADALVHYPKEGGNLFRAIDSLINVQRDKGQGTKDNGQWTKDKGQWTKDKGQWTRDEHTLRFIVHLCGDRFCPMHTARMDDKGGNMVKMKWFGENTNLHTVWDTHLIESQGYSYTEYACKLERQYAHEKRAIEQMTDRELLLHNYHLTEAIYAYQTAWDGNTYHYIYRWRQPMEYQLYVAGIRLAQVLNRMYK